MATLFRGYFMDKLAQLVEQKNIKLPVLGGNLEVSFEVENNMYKNIFLKGPAVLVFTGTLTI